MTRPALGFREVHRMATDNDGYQAVWRIVSGCAVIQELTASGRQDRSLPGETSHNRSRAVHVLIGKIRTSERDPRGDDECTIRIPRTHVAHWSFITGAPIGQLTCVALARLMAAESAQCGCRPDRSRSLRWCRHFRTGVDRASSSRRRP